MDRMRNQTFDYKDDASYAALPAACQQWLKADDQQLTVCFAENAYWLADNNLRCRMQEDPRFVGYEMTPKRARGVHRDGDRHQAGKLIITRRSSGEQP